MTELLAYAANIPIGDRECSFPTRQLEQTFFFLANGITSRCVYWPAPDGSSFFCVLFDGKLLGNWEYFLMRCHLHMLVLEVENQVCMCTR